MPNTDPLILWADERFCSPWGLSAWIVLREKKLPFELKTVNLYAETPESVNFRKRAWNAKIPALEHQGAVVGESLAIIEYLEETFQSPGHAALLPANPRARAADREILSWLRTDLVTLRQCLPFEGLFEPVDPPHLTSDALEEIDQLVNVVQRRLARRDSAAGAAKLGIADFELGYTLKRLVHYRYDLSGFPDVARFAAEIWAHPSVRSWVREPRPALSGPRE